MWYWEFSGADFTTVQTQASVANPLYSPINPHGCAHPVRTPVWACQHSPTEPWAELCWRYGHQPHYRHNQILLNSSEATKAALIILPVIWRFFFLLLAQSSIIYILNMYAGRNHNLDPGCAGAVSDKGIITAMWTNDSNVTVTLYEVNLLLLLSEIRVRHRSAFLERKPLYCLFNVAILQCSAYSVFHVSDIQPYRITNELCP